MIPEDTLGTVERVGGNHLPEKWIEEFSPWVSEDALRSVKLHSNPKITRWLDRFGLFGIVFGVNAYVMGFEYDGYWSVVSHRVVHEAVHIEQIRKWGRFLFYTAYVIMYPFFAAMQSVKQMPFEKRAYQVQHDYYEKEKLKLVRIYRLRSG